VIGIVNDVQSVYKQYIGYKLWALRADDEKIVILHYVLADHRLKRL
jgi:hypothetical protein